jgi:hypothetical protein
MAESHMADDAAAGDWREAAFDAITAVAPNRRLMR